jgi:hypothetical protein
MDPGKGIGQLMFRDITQYNFTIPILGIKDEKGCGTSNSSGSCDKYFVHS